MDKYYVTLFGKKGAEAWVRHAYNIQPHVGLGWTPYRVLVTRGAISDRAFVTFKEFKAWLGERQLRLSPHHKQNYKRSWVARFGVIQ